jgi:DNA repair protein RecN (Recombination protein N)
MLSWLQVRNFAIVDVAEVELQGGMTALTGETGAGKSILVDALGLVLGDRADSSVIRHGEERAEITAGFAIDRLPAAAAWLVERDMDQDGECQLRRIVARDGRSRGYINGHPVPMQALRELGEQLVDIHGQHEHQSLLRTGVQRQLLDAFGGYPLLLEQTAALHAEWSNLQHELETAIGRETDRDARLDLLRYQLEELSAPGLSAADIRDIDTEYARHANAGRLLEAAQAGLQRLDSDEGDAALVLLERSASELGELASLDNALEESTRLLSEAALLVREGVDALRRYTDRLDTDPERMHWLEQRIGILHDLARKHRCTPEELPSVEQQLRVELDQLEHADRHRAALTARLGQLAQDYRAVAQQLGEQRRRAATAFGREITAAMQTLGMAGGVFAVAVAPRNDGRFSASGMDRIEFMVSANKGQAPQPLARVASGGELSRISLAIQVIAAGNQTIPTLIFDEVDSGIGGSVAEIVGRQLRALSSGRQVLCVTHLPQVAACAHQQLQVSKLTGDAATHTRIHALDGEARVEELARMLGGIRITESVRQTAREMMQQAGERPPARKRKARA